MMPSLKSLLNPAAYVRYFRRLGEQRRVRLQPNLRGITFAPPGHFYSPLLDIERLGPGDVALPYDGAECWEHVDLRASEQRRYYEDLLERFPCLPFPKRRTTGYRYFTENVWFALSDAFLLSGVVRRERPRRVIEVGSGFSSAAMLDTLDSMGASARVTFIEPYPGRLKALLPPDDQRTRTILVQPVQQTELALFDELEAGDVLFVDSSHVAKVGSDVTFVFLRVLPRLQPGVLVHFHDVFYPESYPARWVREGRAWNESIVLRALLAGNRRFQVLVFNSFAGRMFPELFRKRLPEFLADTGSSIWLRKAE